MSQIYQVDYTLADYSQLMQEQGYLSDAEFDQMLDDSTDAKFVSNLDQAWQSSKKVRVHFLWGDIESGKTTALEETAELYFKKGMTTFHAWGARDFENLFWAVNMNCRAKFKKKFERQTDKQREIMKSRLYCDCHRAYPIIWIVPEYFEIDPYTLDFFNGVYYRSFEEYSDFVKAGLISPEITAEDKMLLKHGKLKIPKEFREEPLIVVEQVPIPHGKDTEKFSERFIEIILRGREEHRVICMNPASFVNEDEFKVAGKMFEMFPQLVNEYFLLPSEEEVGKMRGLNHRIEFKDWNHWEKAWDKFCVVVNELRTLAPTHGYSPRKGASDTKRPIVDMIPEIRHLRIWFIGDLQSPDDLNTAVRKHAHSVVIKRSTTQILGDEWKWFFEVIETIRTEFFAKFDIDDEKKAPPEMVAEVNSWCPKITEIPKNKGYVVFRNGEFFLETFGMPSFHHKPEHQKFPQLTGIRWKINKIKTDKTVAKADKADQNTQKFVEKQMEDTHIKMLINLKKSGMSFKKALEELNKQADNGDLPKSEVLKLNEKSLSNRINRNSEYKKMLNPDT